MDLATVKASLATREAFLDLCSESRVFGAKRQADRALALWQGAQERAVLPFMALRIPGGTGTGLMLGVYWDPAQVTPDFEGITRAANAELPTALVKANEKAVWGARDAKQKVFFVWRDVHGQELSLWFQERFGVSAFVKQVLSASDFADNAVVVAIADGVDHVWPVHAADGESEEDPLDP